MTELRLVPLAFIMWVTTAAVVFRLSWVAVVALILVFVIAIAVRQFGQAVLLLVGGTVTFVLSSSRVAAANLKVPTQLRGFLVEHPRKVREGTWVTALRSPDFPADVPLIMSTEPPAAGAFLEVSAKTKPSDRAGLVQELVIANQFEVLSPPQGWQALTARIRLTFAQAAEQWLSSDSSGLVPGMVLGDTNMQSEQERQLYIDTGLSHLTAVSGSNVAIVVSSVLIVARFITCPPKLQIAMAFGSLIGYLGIVGTEPSVLRAGITGVIGLLALVNSSKMQPVHGLALAICCLMVWDSNLAVEFGFLLSVAATAGIVILQPLLLPSLTRISLYGKRIPEIVARALGIAIAADLTTAPIIAIMSGRVPLVSVVTNLLVAPVIGLITVLGIVSVVCSLLPGKLERVPFFIVDPCAKYVHWVAETFVGPEIYAPSMWILCGCLWIAYGFYRGFGKHIVGAFLSIVALWYFPSASAFRRPAEVPLNCLNVVVEQKIVDEYEPPEGTQVVVVLDAEGRRKVRPTITRRGIPVLFPNRDGEVFVLEDGTQRAADGRF
ncbi:ComEC/Rec2 family competence protein [Corynebacterium freiburgense]|uniref:ComEC/Rec2 family competence protein n=1 Tax=Corynebacterium freiburgense TaxID=556548 RepID=UPI000425D1CA|nr:ComEC/Rec2 family competence protein [Corynebacterium freiburgense]WJZ03374.1 ComEC family competence protein [Corynebacterium freiburgense]